MAFLKNLDQKMKNFQNKLDGVTSETGQKIYATTAKYIGGYKDFKESIGTLSFYENGIRFDAPLSSSKFFIKIDETKDIKIEGKDDINRRVTVTRLLALGIFAFALQKEKREQEAYVVVEDKEGFEAIFKIDNKTPLQTRAVLGPILQKLKQLS